MTMVRVMNLLSFGEDFCPTSTGVTPSRARCATATHTVSAANTRQGGRGVAGGVGDAKLDIWNGGSGAPREVHLGTLPPVQSV
jgi:hypothetical protein